MDGITLDDASDFIVENKGAIAIGAGAAIVGGAILGASLLGSSSKKSSKKRTRRGIARDRKYVSRQKHERNYKRKTKGKYYKTKNRKSGKIKYTKNGQPYIIMKSGKAKFISKSKSKRR